MKKVFALFDGFLENVIFICTVGYVILSFLQVIFRYVFNNSLVWSEEMCRYLFVWTVFFGSAIALKSRKHIAVDLLDKAFPVKIRKFYYVFIDLIIIIFLIVFMIIGAQLAARNMTQLSPAMQIPLGIVYLAIPIGSFVMIINAVRTAITDFKLGEKRFENSEGGNCVC
jgi:C4-dicarboxylate transporter DctQ subunit